jgi:xanthine dehydrogenase accessory factor
MRRAWASDALQRVEAGTPVALITFTEVLGSAPREPGAQMLVWADGQSGTIGGGNLELMLTRDARALLGAGDVSDEFDYPLGPILGQCCGGRVRARIERLTRESAAALVHEAIEAEADWPALYLFGAGHVGEALSHAFESLPFRLHWRDTRPEFCDVAMLTSDPCAEVVTSEVGAFFLVLTHNHDLDYEIVRSVLTRRDAAYCGLIGSKSKRARFERQLRADGLGEELHKLTCPIGGAIGLKGKEPAVIAAATVAEMLIVLEARQARAAENAHAE